MQLPPNQWQIQSANAFESYTKNFLAGHDAVAAGDLKRAIAHAKAGGDFESLARIYLGMCALRISVGRPDVCSEYQEIAEFTSDPSLKNYYALLQNTTDAMEPSLLPTPYKSFALHLQKNEYDSAFTSLEDAPLSSKLIGAALLKEHLDRTQVENILESASFYGYKKSVLYWLSVLEELSESTSEKEAIRKKIEILKRK
jgi:hypothetical protein